MAEPSWGTPPPNGDGDRRRTPALALAAGALVLVGALFAAGFLVAGTVRGDDDEGREARSATNALPTVEPSTIETTVSVAALAAAPPLPAELASTGAGSVQVPDVRGLPEEPAVAAIRAAGLEPAVEGTRGGIVAEQFPGPGASANEGDVVRIVLRSEESGPVAVPPVVGEPRDAAVSALEGAGLAVRVVDEETSDPALDGVVTAQQPPGGQRVPRGATVTITVGRLVSGSP